jgi:hypothetical protein
MAQIAGGEALTNRIPALGARAGERTGNPPKCFAELGTRSGTAGMHGAALAPGKFRYGRTLRTA